MTDLSHASVSSINGHVNSRVVVVRIKWYKQHIFGTVSGALSHDRPSVDALHRFIYR